jgi:hypothetical protein
MIAATVCLWESSICSLTILEKSSWLHKTSCLIVWKSSPPSLENEKKGIMKLSTAFNIILSVTTLAIAKASANVSGKNAASRLRGETGSTRHLNPLKKSAKASAVETTVEEKAFDVRLQEGATYSLFEHGMIEVFVECGTSEVRVTAVVTNDSTEDTMSTFGDSQCEGAFSYSVPPLDSVELELWDVSSTGNDIDDSAVGTSMGFYVGLDGETTIGLQRDNANALADYGDNVNCVFMGVFHMFFNEPGEVILAA